MENKKKKPSGCGIALLILFYPVGMCYLIYWLLSRKTVRDGHYRERSNQIAIAAGVLYFCGIFYLIAALTGNVEAEDPGQIIYGTVVMLIVCCGGGIAMMGRWLTFRRIGILYERYAPLVVKGDMEDIRQMAPIVGCEYECATLELERLIAFGALDDCYINYEKGTLVWPNRPKVSLPR